MTKLNTREFRRKRAIDLLKKGWKQDQIAEALGVSQGAISQWKSRYEKEGSGCWRDKTIPGAPSRLGSKEERLLGVIITKGAQAYGFQGDFWTHKRVSRVIKEEFNEELSPKQCGRILRKLNFTRQKPQKRSYYQNQEKVDYWKEQQLPALKKM